MTKERHLAAKEELKKYVQDSNGKLREETGLVISAVKDDVKKVQEDVGSAKEDIKELQKQKPIILECKEDYGRLRALYTELEENQLTEEKIIELIQGEVAEFQKNQAKEEKIIETTWMQWFGNAFRFVVV